MENAKMKVVRFGDSDVIATSGLTLVISGTFNGTKNDATFTFNSTTYSSNDIMNNQSIAKSYFGENVYGAYFYKSDGSDRIGGQQLFSLANIDKNGNNGSGDYIFDERTSNDYNNTYIFENGNFYIKQ